MEVGMAGRAIVRDILKYQIDVARTASNIGMLTTKRVGSLRIVVELRVLPDGRPTCGRMARIAAHGQGAVRIARSGLVLASREKRQQQK